MVKKFLIGVFFLASLVFLGYLSVPNYSFPSPPPDSVQSKEPSDTESTLRRAYFTNYSREEVLNWYLKEFMWGYRLNYPPENAATIIRDQTRSTFLEEIIHPFRESIYINGFEPKDSKDAINIDGTPWRQKIIVRYIPSNLFIRIVMGILTIVAAGFLIKEYTKYGKSN